MNKDTIMSNKKFFLENLPKKAQEMFYSNPKLFRKNYQKDLNNIIKQDLFYLVEIATPALERSYCSDHCYVWESNDCCFHITPKNKTTVQKILNIYAKKSFEYYKNNVFIKSGNPTTLFKTSRAIYYYINYKKPELWKMTHIKPFYRSAEIVYKDFVFLSDEKLDYTKQELEQKIATGCEQIANELIDTEIRRICEVNRQIKQAKEIFAKYGTELIRGY